MLDLKVTAEAIAEALHYPIQGWPFAHATKHGKSDAWVTLRAETRLKPDLSEKSDAADTLSELLIKVIANDIGELMVMGDTDSEDHYLAKLNGLRKMTTWPEELWISKDIEIRYASELQHAYKTDKNGELVEDADGSLIETDEKEPVDTYVLIIHVAWNWEAKPETAIAS